MGESSPEDGVRVIYFSNAADWNYDAGGPLRLMMAGGLVRFDVAFRNVESGIRVILGHPF
jgi:hypothetical protein